MLYKGNKDVRILVLKTDDFRREISSDKDIEEAIIENLSSMDFEKNKNWYDINLLEFKVTSDNNSSNAGEYDSDMYWRRIYTIIYTLIKESKKYNLKELKCLKLLSQTLVFG